MSTVWRTSAEFDMRHYPAAVQAQVVRCRYQAERRLPRCSICGRKRQVWGVVCHPGLKQVRPPEGLVPLPYALCKAHAGMTVEAIGAVVYGEAWGQAAPGEL